MAAATIAIEMIQNVIPTGSVGSKLPEAKLRVGSPANKIAGNIYFKNLSKTYSLNSNPNLKLYRSLTHCGERITVWASSGESPYHQMSPSWCSF